VLLLPPILVTFIPDRGFLVILLMMAVLALVVVVLFASVFASKRRHSGAFAGSRGVYTGGSYSPGRRQVLTKTPARGGRRRQ
jgi:hypothetical protein